ncbi:DUF302 domain-containing protein [Hydrogenimonas thermophila]|uniref:DUF302 domain-containing protein n=1 Tax=Hydrogenimonas thermophila TaxID=223786 RepID=UPI002937457B|nr:DUF302 domain-containing protein [Hydrogenimonas thermophila]WOE71103.1 DUF302 domain-containing protein [Hydrogenimonas thermophila]
MKPTLKLIIIMLIFTGAFADNKDIILFNVKKSDKVTTKSIEDTFTKAGYIVETNRDMNGPFIKQFKDTNFSIYNLMTLYYPEITKDLLVKYEESGVFAPFSIVIYQKKGDDAIYAGVLSSSAQAKILGLSYNNELLQKLEAKNIETLLKALPGAKRVKFNYTPKAVTNKLLTRFEVEIDDEDIDIEEFKEEIEMVIEDGLKPIGFVMANFFDSNYFLNENNIKIYDFYDTYSLCKLKVIYTVSKMHPEAGVFAPCTMALYKKKGSNNVKIVYPNVYNWISTLAIDDPESVKVLEKAQADMVELLQKVND